MPRQSRRLKLDGVTVVVVIAEAGIVVGVIAPTAAIPITGTAIPTVVVGAGVVSVLGSGSQGSCANPFKIGTSEGVPLPSGETYVFLGRGWDGELN